MTGKKFSISGMCLRAALAAVIGGFVFNAHAHHPIVGKFDNATDLALRGIVTRVDWRSPHTHVFMNVESGGTVSNWAVELASPPELVDSGWRYDSLVPGDAILVDGWRARDGSRQVWGNTVRLASNGRRVYNVTDQAPPTPLSPRPVPRWDDGQVALGATPGSVGGYWSFPSANVLVEDGRDIEFTDDGLLLDPRDARRVAPMQPWARALFEHRQARQLRDDPQFLHCKPPGGPRQYQSNLGFQLMEDRERERIFVLLGSGNRNFRIIYLDGREQVGQVGGDDDNPLYYGRSVAEWEGDTLVVDTRSFNEDFWLSSNGIPHTNSLRLTERFTRVDFDTLEYEVTIDDPGAYTRPWTASWTLRWVGGAELPWHLCQHNRP